MGVLHNLFQKVPHIVRGEVQSVGAVNFLVVRFSFIKFEDWLSVFCEGVEAFLESFLGIVGTLLKGRATLVARAFLLRGIVIYVVDCPTLGARNTT